MPRLTVLLPALLGAGVATQAPEYMQQYSQRIGGAVDELQRFVDDFDSDARRAGYSRDEALEEHRSAGQPLFVNRAVSMDNTLDRLDGFEAHKQALDSASPVGRLPVFLSGYDRQLAQRTFDDYKPAIPTTLEGAVYGAGGFAAVYVVLRLLGGLFRRRRRA